MGLQLSRDSKKGYDGQIMYLEKSLEKGIWKRIRQNLMLEGV